MITPLSYTTQDQPISRSAPVAETLIQSKPLSTITDTVQISRKVEATLHEAQEAADHTTYEANHGNLQAQRLLAKHVAEKATPEENQQTKQFEVDTKA